MKISKEEFIEIVYSLKEQSDKHKELYKFGIDLINYESNYEKCFSVLKKIVFNEKQLDLIDWWLYEDVEKVLFNKDETVFKNLSTASDLYDYIVEL